MRSLILIFVAGSAACATGGAATGGAVGSQTARVSGATGSNVTTLVNNDQAATTSIPGVAMADAWRVLPTVYQSLGIPITALDNVRHLIGNDGFDLRGRLGKASLSEYIDCGRGQIGARTDSYQVHLAVRTKLMPDSAGETSVSSFVEAVGKPITVSQDYSRCSTRGELERRIADGVKAQLRK